MKQITTTEHATSLGDLRVDQWHVVGTQKHGYRIGEGWVYSIPTSEVRKFRTSIHYSCTIIACKRYEEDKAVLLAKLAKPENPRARMR